MVNYRALLLYRPCIIALTPGKGILKNNLTITAITLALPY